MKKALILGVSFCGCFFAWLVGIMVSYGSDPKQGFFVSALLVGFVGIICWAKITMICQEAQLEVMLGKMGVKHGTCPRS